MGFGDLWNTIFLNPMLNIMVVLCTGLFYNFGLAIIVFTLIIRIITYPLTIKQLKASKAMQGLQPRIQELQKKYGSDKQKLSQEMAQLYKEMNISPAGCIVPMLIQFPIWIALYQAILKVMAATPDDLVSLSSHLYSWSLVQQTIPVGSHFLWLNLAQPDRYPVMAVLVAASMWLQQKMVTPESMDPRQARTNSMMLWMMPIMFGLFTMQFASGLALYWFFSNVIGIIIQYFVTGWGGLKIPGLIGGTPVKQQAPEKSIHRADITMSGKDLRLPGGISKEGKRLQDGKSRDKRKDR